MEGIEFVAGGTATSPRGFLAGATAAGVKEAGVSRLDLGILFSEVPCTAAALFTTNRIKAAPLLLCREYLRGDRARAVVVNSGCANAFTGEVGRSDADEMAALVAKGLGVAQGEVLVASTGVIGERLPMERIRSGLERITLTADGGHDLVRAMMTTDTVPKEAAVTVGGFTIGGVAKGSGMIHPDMATMLCFLTTDAALVPDFLRSALKQAVDISFNMVSVDGDTSTNDMVLVLANGLVGGEPVTWGSEGAALFQEVLDRVCVYLAREMARDGEGAGKLIEVTVRGAHGVVGARQAARTVVGSSLVKTAVYGHDPNWGRVVAAVGRSGVEVVPEKIDLAIGGVDIVRQGSVLPFAKDSVVTVLKGDEVSIELDLNLGAASATAWGCDLTEEYVRINSEYTT